MSERRPEWPEVRDHCKKFIETSRRALEQPLLDVQTTEFERGKIMALRNVLRLSEPAPETPSDTPIKY
jgi:nitrogen fixation protein